jgi:branched-chain amino acid transport system substrate-binding protein
MFGKASRVSIGAALLLIGGLVGTTGTAASAASAKAPIVIGFVTSETGGASSSYIGAQWGAEARIDAQNAAGGVDGHKLQLVIEDDQSSATENLTAAQELVENKNAFGIIEDSSFTFGASKYLNQQGIPVTGAEIDGPEWGQQPNTNMFSVTGVGSTPINGNYYTYNTTAEFLKDIGVTKLGQVVYNITSAISAANAVFSTAKQLGISDCYDNTSIPFGDVNFTAIALQIKSAGCNGIIGVSLLATDIALSGAIKQAGIKTQQLYYTAYDQNLLDQPTALAQMQGDYSSTAISVATPNTATRLYLSRLKKYTAWPGGIPSLNVDYGYLSADLMILGLQKAGENPTRTAFIKKLRQDSDYTADGLLPSPVIFSHFGTIGMFPKMGCTSYVEIKGKGFVAYDGGKKVCAPLIEAPA